MGEFTSFCLQLAVIIVFILVVIKIANEWRLRLKMRSKGNG